MCLALIAVFADESGQMQIGRRDFQTDLLARLTAGAGVGRFTGLHLQFTAARTPEAAVRFLRAFEQQDFASFIEAVEQRGDFVGQSHRTNFKWRMTKVERGKMRFPDLCDLRSRFAPDWPTVHKF